MDVFNPAALSFGSASPIDAYYDILQPLCISGLRKALDPDAAIFNRQIRNGRIESTFGSEDLTSTCICLIGIDRHGLEQGALPASCRTILKSASSLARRRRYIGGFGLLAWANAVHDDMELDQLANEIGVSPTEDGLHDRLTTMELAWLLSGLLHEAHRTGKSRDRDRARAAACSLRERYSPSARVMNHASVKAPFRHRMRGRIANFADQIYAVQAFAFSTLVDADFLDVANSLAQNLVDRQGSLGQWWWHYDARTGAPAEIYPVYSVHQHAMAPMAFMALAAAGGRQFETALARGLSWLGANELGVDMVDQKAQTIWRDLHRNESSGRSLIRKMQELTGSPRNAKAAPGCELVLNRETRPYEWAWCLYARAIANSFERKGHIV